MKIVSFRNLRILILLILLAIAAIYSKGQALYSTAWLNPLPVIIFPVNGDGAPETTRYIESLQAENFTAIDDFMAREAAKYEVLEKRPTHTQLGAAVEALPPEPPAGTASVLEMMLWSLKLRYWAWQHTPDDESNRNRVRIFVLYHQGEAGKALSHSLGLQKGLLGIVNAYALEKQGAQNNLIIAHELLHTVGASDKYDEYNQPRYPDGYADPGRSPLYPQYKAEIMSGRIPTSKQESTMAKGLHNCVVGRSTAWEINWLGADGA
jgi:hypothetical protein